MPPGVPGVELEHTHTFAMPKPVLYAREVLRTSVTIFALGIYVFILVKALGFAHTLQDFEVLMALFLPPLVAVIASAGGFLFGSRGRA